MADRRTLAISWLLVLGACTGGHAAAVRATPSPSYFSVPPLTAPCAPSSRPLRVVARNVKFDRTCLAAPEGKAFTIRFENLDPGVDHNIDVLPAPWGYNRPPKALFFGTIVHGVATVTYTVGGLPAGLHTLVCFVHHDVMYGLFAVPPTLSHTLGTLRPKIHVLWGSAPAGFVFDVQVRRPGATAFVPWLTAVTIPSADYVADADGRYAFRVSLYRAGFTPLGYSPPASIVVSP